MSFYVRLVKQVLKEHKRIHIVHYDWLEFSAVFNKRLSEKDYSMRCILAKEKAEQRERDRHENGRRQGERGVNPSKSSACSFEKDDETLLKSKLMCRLANQPCSTSIETESVLRTRLISRAIILRMANLDSATQ